MQFGFWGVAVAFLLFCYWIFGVLQRILIVSKNRNGKLFIFDILEIYELNRGLYLTNNLMVIWQSETLLKIIK